MKIHAGWLKPMPRYWHDFYERDAAILEAGNEPGRLFDPNEPRPCQICGEVFVPNSPLGARQRTTCHRDDCRLERRRRNARVSARRAADRKLRGEA